MTYQINETFKIVATIVDNDNIAVDPISVKISVRNPDRSLAVDAASMIKSTTGSYYYWNTVSNQVGTHYVKIVSAGTYGNVIETYEYEVVESFGI